jgi:uncharacterized protein YkwD/uncharacterized membrane protein required for colicin V production
MNVVDVFLFIVILLSIYGGYVKGFITGMLQLLIFAAGLVSAFFLYPYVATFLEKFASSLGIWKIPLSFLIALVIARIVFSFIANRFLLIIPESAHTSDANHVMGIIPGGINGFIWALLLSALLLSIPVSDRISALARNSKFAGRMADKVGWLDEKVSPFFDELVNQPFGKVKIPGSGEAVRLPFKKPDAKVREDLEQKMLVLLNEEREKMGLKSLKPDPEMLAVAREHSKDMFSRGYFAHETPEGLSPFDRMKKAKVWFLAAGENLALGQTLYICHRGLMNSPGHRKNILNPAFRRVGIAVLDRGIYGLMITQNFRN